MIEIDGVYYHSTEIYDDNYENVIGEELVLDEQGEPIPSTICICAAHEPNECCCGAWDDVDPVEWYSDEY